MITAVETIESHFRYDVVDPLAKLDVCIDQVHYDEPAGELRVDIYLPPVDHQLRRQLRTEAIEAIRRFEEARGCTVAVIAALLVAGGQTENPQDW